MSRTELLNIMNDLKKTIRPLGWADDTHRIAIYLIERGNVKVIFMEPKSICMYFGDRAVYGYVGTTEIKEINPGIMINFLKSVTIKDAICHN